MLKKRTSSDSAFKLQEEDDAQSIMSVPNGLKTISTDAAHRLEENIKAPRASELVEWAVFQKQEGKAEQEMVGIMCIP